MEAERQRQKYSTLVRNDDDPSPTLIDDFKYFENEKAALLEQKRRLEASSSIDIRNEPISDAQIDEYIARIREVLLGSNEALARRILEHFVDRVRVQMGSSTGTLYYTFPSDFFIPNLSPLRMHSLEGFRVRAPHQTSR